MMKNKTVYLSTDGYPLENVNLYRSTSDPSFYRFVDNETGEKFMINTDYIVRIDDYDPDEEL